MYNVGNLKYGSMYFEDEPDTLTSRYKIERINTMIKEKKSEIERLKYIINLYERERINMIKERNMRKKKHMISFPILFQVKYS